MTLRARDRVRAVHKALLLQGGRNEELARELADALVELEAAARGGAASLRTIDDAGDGLEVELARLVGAMPFEKRALLFGLLLEVDDERKLAREVARRRELEELAAARGFR